MRITYRTVKFTAKLNGRSIRGTFTPNGTPEHFFEFLNATACKLGVRGAGFDRETQYEWGTAIFADTDAGKMVIFLR